MSNRDPISDEWDYDMVLDQISTLMDKDNRTEAEEKEYLELVTLIENYDEIHYPIDKLNFNDLENSN